MLIRLLPGATSSAILEELRRVCTALENLRTAHHGGHPVDRREQYLEWANTAGSGLRHLLGPDDVGQLIMTPAFWHIQSMAVMANGTTLTINNEIDARKTELERLRDDLTAQVGRWSGPRIVVPDASMFCRHDDLLGEWDLAPLLQAAVNEPILIVIPMAVVDQLDRLKKTGNDHTRWRARHSLAVLDRALPDPRVRGTLRPEQFVPGRGPISVEIILDSPGHVRLPDDDDEIVDQAYTVSRLAAGPLTFMTYDTGQSTRARGRGLDCKKLPDPPVGDEPPKPWVKKKGQKSGPQGQARST